MVWLTLAAFAIGQQPARAQSHEDGVAAGTAANAAIRGMVNDASARSVVPRYTSTPAETAYVGQPSLAAQARARQLACQATPDDPSCQGIQTATASANTPRPTIGADDPAVADASRIAKNPSVQLGSLSAYYSGCSVADVTTGTRTEERSCRRVEGVGAYSCSKALTVGITRIPSCTPGDWVAHGASGNTGIDAQCLPDRPDSAQHFRITDNGNPISYFDVDMAAASSFPQKVAPGVYVGDKSCIGLTCSLTALVAPAETKWICGNESSDFSYCEEIKPFVETGSDCPAGTVGGEALTSVLGAMSPESNIDYYFGPTLDRLTCYKQVPFPEGVWAVPANWTSVEQFWAAASRRSVVGWNINSQYGPIPRINLTYQKARTTVVEEDKWIDYCPTLAAASRCAVTASPKCTAGAGTRTIDGAAVTRSCWEYQSNLSCAGTSSGDQCAPLVAAGCTAVSSSCLEVNPVTGACEVFDDKYACSVSSQTVTTASNCAGNKFCLGSSCFDISQTSDPDFARSMSYLEASREAGVYLDPDKMEVFAGEQNQCGDRLLKNCCYADSAGKGMSNQSAFGGAGSRLVFDMLMKSSNRAFVTQGLQALLMGGGFSGTYTTYGVTVAVNGAALPAGSTVLFSSSAVAGEGFVVAFDPWSLAIAVVIYIVMSMMACSEDEGKLAMKEGAGLCHEVGSFCSSRFLWSCTEEKHTKCCFNSVLARILNEQGRLQVGKGWGSAQAADCSGFTIAQLQSLDFATMDLSEFYASIVPMAPDVNLIQTKNAAAAPGCYYGKGKC
jgi:conjugal transfer mating pair stabilization protein TraN